MTDDEWSALEQAWADAEQEKLDLVRIRGYALVCCEAATKAREDVEKAVDAMMRARRRAERMLARANRICAIAEQSARFAARAMAGDVEPATRAEAATALEELFG